MQVIPKKYFLEFIFQIFFSQVLTSSQLCIYFVSSTKRNMKRISTPSQMKPKSEGEISQFKKVSPEGKISQYSVYLLDGQFHLVHGLIFHVRQNHTVAKSNKSFAAIAKAII